jgi:chemotaxis protein CheX
MSPSTDLLASAPKSVVAATVEVFNTMLGGSLIEVPDGVTGADTEVSAIVGFGGKYSGFVAVHFRKDAACKVASAMLAGMEVNGVDDMVRDALGEVGNMIAGGFKKILSEDLGETAFQISLPTVVEGSGLSTQGPASATTTRTSMKTDDYGLELQLVIEPSR